MEKKRFNKQEAFAKIGRRIRTLTEWSGVPKGTTGIVVRADSAGYAKPVGGEKVEEFDIAVEWELLGRIGKPLIDWFLPLLSL